MTYTDDKYFVNAVDIVLEHEGGFVNDPVDPGGATNFGITFRTLQKWRGQPITVQDVIDLTPEEAKEIYFAEYWKKSNCHSILDKQLSGQIFDMAVNGGPKRAIKLFQETMNEQYEARLIVDGDFGHNTMSAYLDINLVPESQRVLNLAYFKARCEFYIAITRRRKTSRKFLYAWFKRSLSYV